MTPERWRAITDVFHGALERTGDARLAFIKESTAGDPEMAREVETLLRSHEKSGAFLNEPAWGVGAKLILDDEPAVQGRRIGAYRVLEELGRGGMGVVYAAVDERLGREVALKALAPEYSGDEARRHRLTREARAAAALSHPNIATIYALEEIDGALYMVSELVRGSTLRQELSGGPLPSSRLVPTLCDIASALVAAHERGIVHRDLKPENIIRRTDGQVKVLDFGLARMQPSPNQPTSTKLTEAGFVVGTPGYMAPEQLAGAPVDARADIFAFGVLVWELSTGEHPFGADTAALLARMTELMDGRPLALSRPLPVPGLDRIARRCMRGRPEDRYPSSAELLSDLQAVTRAITAGAGSPIEGAHSAFWWWQFHQAAISGLNTLAPIAAWAIRRIPAPPYGLWLFYAVLVLATISVTLRLNLLFVARVHPDLLHEQRARLFPAIAAADALLGGALIVASALIAGTQNEAGALLLVVAIVMLASLALVEPATSRAAGFRK